MSIRPVYRVLTENYTEVCVLPTPTKDGVKITPERIWSQNAGRVSTTGMFVGDVITVKHTITLSYDSLAEAQVQQLIALTDTTTPFWILEYPFNTITKRSHCYIAPPTYTVKQWSPELQTYVYSDVLLEFIER